MHQKQGHCVDRQLVHLEDKGISQIPAPHPQLGPRSLIPVSEGKETDGSSCKVVSSPL